MKQQTKKIFPPLQQYVQKLCSPIPNLTIVTTKVQTQQVLQIHSPDPLPTP
jgi:hypothetical protein